MFLTLNKAAPLVRADFYCDASSHRGHDYMVAGGILIRQERYHEIEAKIQEIKKAAGIVGEMKWTKYRGGAKQAAYESLVDFAFLLLKEKQAAFHLIIAHFGNFDHKREPDANRETSVNRMYYQLAVHRLCRKYGKTCAIHIYPDHGDDSADLPKFRTRMCASGYTKHGAKPNCIRDIQPQCSKKHNTLQMVDVLIGAIAAKRNNRTLVLHKASLADYVLAKSGHQDWAKDTSRLASFFTVWNFKAK